MQNYDFIFNLHGGQLSESYIKKNYYDFYTFLNETYPKDILFKEKVYWFKNKIETYPVCLECGKRLKINEGYGVYCSKECANKSKYRTLKTKNTKLKRYGDENFVNSEKAKQTCLERYGMLSTQLESVKNKSKNTKLKRYGDENFVNSEKAKQTCLERYGVINGGGTFQSQEKIKQTLKKHYGVEHALQNKQLLEKSKHTCLERFGKDNFNKTKESKIRYLDKLFVEKLLNERKKTCIERYNTDSYSKTTEYKKKYKETSLKRFGVDSYTKTKEYKERAYQTKKKNHTFNSSSIEKEFELYLKENQIEYKTQYTSDVYPFSCDFYLPKYDLYLEINAHWTHGGHPFDCNNLEDQTKLEQWKSKGTEFYNNAITTWTVRDVKKRNTAKQNNLNYLEIFSSNINDLIKILYDTLSIQQK